MTFVVKVTHARAVKDVTDQTGTWQRLAPDTEEPRCVDTCNVSVTFTGYYSYMVNIVSCHEQ